jgi:hypothetical protein
MRLHHHILQPAAVKYPAIRFIVLLITHVQAGLVDIKRIRVFHRELPHAYQPRLRPRLVSELVLYLVPDLRKLLVAAQLFARDVGHHLFMRHAQAQVRALAVFQAKHVFTHHLPASALLPQFARIERRQQELLANLVHLVANHINDLQYRPLRHEQIGVNACAHLPDVSRADKKLVAGDLGIRRGLAQSGNKKL